jgi:antitoxin component YwqK of YwqJK toxin-antitoxin module
MNEEKKKQVVALIVIIVLIIIGIALRSKLKTKPGPPPPPSPTPVSSPKPELEKNISKAEKPSDFIEKTEYYDSKELKAKYYVSRKEPGLKQKEYKEYYKSGKIKIECVYKDDNIEGLYSYFYENGQKAMEGNFVHGVKEGAFIEYHPNGKKKFSYSYFKNQLNDSWQEFYNEENSPIAIEKIYKNGELLSEIHKKKNGSVKFQKNYVAEAQNLK